MAKVGNFYSNKYNKLHEMNKKSVAVQPTETCKYSLWKLFKLLGNELSHNC